MKTSRILLTSVAVLSAVSISAVLAADSSNTSPIKKWQHLAFETKPSLKDSGTGRQINELGRDGWELVDVTQISEEGSTEKFVYFFKKPLE